MVRNLFIHRCLVTGVLLLACVASQALTLGRTRGAVLIGQPLSVDVQLGLAAGETASALCLEADVFHADTLIPASKVSVATVLASGNQAVLRIRSQAVVDEPFIMLFVRAGCTEKVTRRYVLLADVASELATPGVTITPALVPAPVSAASAAPPVAVAAPGSPVQVQGLPKTAIAPPLLPPAQVAAVQAVAAAPAATPVRQPRPRRVKPAPAATPANETVRPAAQKPAALAGANVAPNRPSKPEPKATKPVPKPQGARLVIDPLELVAERDPVLRLSSEMLSTPNDNVQQRAAAAALWRALNTQPLDLLRDLERIERLEAQANTVRIQNSQQQERIEALNIQLEKARIERYENPLVYTLYGLLALTLAGAGYFWWRARKVNLSDPAWWLAQQNQPPEEQAWPASSPATAVAEKPVEKTLNAKPHTRPGTATQLPKAASAAAADVAPDDLDLDLSKPALRSRARINPPPKPQPVVTDNTVDFGLSQMGRAVNAEELIDVQQQADFFVSLGQYDQAINVLKDHIQDSAQTSAVAYLDLLHIYHSIDRKVDYSLLRDEFQKVFNAHAPKFSDFGVRTRGLESYFVAMARIQALWPSPKVLDVIAESIFRKPGEADGEAFDLEAYRDLILLHTLVKTLMEDDSSGNTRPAGKTEAAAPSPASPSLANQRNSGATASGFPSTDIQPLSAVSDQASPNEPLPDLVPDLFKPPASMRLGLDFDLSKLDALPAPSRSAVRSLPPSASLDMRLADLPEPKPETKASRLSELPDTPSA